MTIIVTARDGESGDALLSRFTKLVQRDGILREVKRRRHFISNGEKARLARQQAARRRARALRSKMPSRGTRYKPLASSPTLRPIRTALRFERRLSCPMRVGL